MTDRPNLYDFGEDLVEAAPAPTDAELRTVATLVARLAQVQADKDRLEAELKETNKLLQQLSEIDLPEALVAAGHTCPSKEMIAGHRIEFTEKFRCGQLDNQSNPDGFAYLNETGHGDLAKHTVNVQLPREMSDEAQALVDMIRRQPLANAAKIDYKATVAWNTLSGWAKEMLEQGVDIPLDRLKVQRVRSVKVTS